MKSSRRLAAGPGGAVTAPTPTPADVTLLLLKGLNILLARAEEAQLATAVRIMVTARAELAGWAADQPAQATKPGSYICERLFHGRVFSARQQRQGASGQ